QERTDTETALRRRRLAGIAAELAVDLADGDACPVCGAIEHPHPAGAAEDAVGPEQVEAAETERRAAEAAHSRAEQEHALARQELTRLREAAGDLTPETARTAFDEETARLSRAKEADALAAERERTELTAATTALETDRARIAEARGQDESVAARRRAHRARARAATELREALRARTTAEERAAELAEDATRARSTADLATDEAARAAVLPAEERTRLQKLVQTRAVDESRLSDGLAEEGIAETTATEEARRQAEAHV